ncbi:hypothetical protein ACSNOK_07575 [Streptomyces sp. URMC 126]|uniref:hypothetical protein n=1 Tax=Streptomyces sp. URMC 126 TaxID=3423401 RepID=UPI003F1BEAC9
MTKTPSDEDRAFTGAATASAPQAVTSVYTARWDYGPHHGRNIYHYTWEGVITPRTRVFVTVSEGQGENRFVGAAPMSVENVAPRNGYVDFRLFIDWPTDLGVVADFLFVNP